MLGHLRGRTSARRALVALAFLALALKIAFPPGFMAGSSFAQPIVICTGQGPATMMIEHDGPRPEAPHHADDHPCSFAGHGATPLTPDLRTADLVGTPIATSAAIVRTSAVAPGRGMAAPPPPSHAPPALRA